MPEHAARQAYSARTRASQRAFLEAYKVAGTVTAACAAVGRGCSLQAVRNWDRDNVLGFSVAYSDAREAWADYLEQLAYKRVIQPDGTKGSDLLLITLLNAHKPSKYRQQAVQLEVGPRVLDALRAAQARDSLQGDTLGPGVVDGAARELGPAEVGPAD